MAQLTIQGYNFDVAPDPAINVGAVMEAGHVASLQQTRLENIRNNFAGRIRKELGEAEKLTDEQVAKLASELTAYANEYKFGERRGATGPRVVDPVEREMRAIARADIVQVYTAKTKQKPDAEWLKENVVKLLEAKGADYRRRAERVIRDRNTASEQVLAGLGIAA